MTTSFAFSVLCHQDTRRSEQVSYQRSPQHLDYLTISTTDQTWRLSTCCSTSAWFLIPAVKPSVLKIGRKRHNATKSPTLKGHTLGGILYQPQEDFAKNVRSSHISHISHSFADSTSRPGDSERNNDGATVLAADDCGEECSL